MLFGWIQFTANFRSAISVAMENKLEKGKTFQRCKSTMEQSFIGFIILISDSLAILTTTGQILSKVPNRINGTVYTSTSVLFTLYQCG